MPAEENDTMFGRKKKKAAAQDAAPQQPEAAPSAEDLLALMDLTA